MCDSLDTPWALTLVTSSYADKPIRKYTRGLTSTLSNTNCLSCHTYTYANAHIHIRTYTHTPYGSIHRVSNWDSVQAPTSSGSAMFLPVPSCFYRRIQEHSRVVRANQGNVSVSLGQQFPRVQNDTFAPCSPQWQVVSPRMKAPLSSKILREQ